MSDFLSIAAVLLIILLILAGLAGIALLLLYVALSLFEHWTRPAVINSMKNYPEGTIFTAHSKLAGEAFSEIAPVFAFWSDRDSDELTVKIGTELGNQVKESKALLKRNHIYRHLRFQEVRLTAQKNGTAYRKWNNTDKEWQACELSASMLETYTDGAGNDLIAPNFFETANITYTMSRRLREEERAKLKKKNKFGLKITDKTDFYKEMGLKDCPSCGAPLPQDIKDVVCPYCGATIFADFYDWQVESIEIEPETTKKFLASLFKNHKAGKRVTNKKKGKRNKIVRFSENDFRKDVLEACKAETDRDRLVDLFLGELKIKSVKNTDTDTVLGIQVPVYKTVVSEKGEILSSNEILKAHFTRTRYPGRFNKDTAVISEERFCPNCGGAFSPDKKGNCVHCGSFLFQDELKWKKVEDSKT